MTEPAGLEGFVPRLAVELAAGGSAVAAEIAGSMLSADISGFTALSERLASKGKAGAEEITSLINECFTALIDAAYGYGGEIIKFGGDALLVLFRGDAHERRCANACLAMQVALHASSASKRANLTMTVGASHGPFDVFLVGSGYRDLLIIGDAASEVIRLEGSADKGETLVSPTIAAHMPASIHGRDYVGGVALLGDAVDPRSQPAERDLSDVDLAPFVPPQVVSQLDALSEFGGEHRLVSVGFVMVTGIAAVVNEHGRHGAAEVLSDLIDGVIGATAPYNVTALHTDIADDGFKVVLCAGAPVTSGDTSDALLQAALDVTQIDTPLVLRQGAQTGRVFAGFLGAPYRRTYTLMGDPVNTAARMLGPAGDRDVVAVDSMVKDTRTVFITDELEPFLVKGKTEPIVAHRVLAASDDVKGVADKVDLIGRDPELDRLVDIIDRGAVADIVGPAGSGKSRLMRVAIDSIGERLVFRSSCTPFGVTSPYSAMRPLLRSAYGIDVFAGAEEAGELLDKIVKATAPHLSGMLPLLAIPFGADVASTPEADSIDPSFRRARLHDAVVDLIDATLVGSALLIVEDVQWVDDASGELIEHLVAATADRPWAGVITRRPDSSFALDSDLGHVEALDLRPLESEAVARLAIAASPRALSDAEIDAVVQRADGNPLFALELVAALEDGDIDELPSSVEVVIAARIDDLRPDLRRLIRIASAVGTTFAWDDVAELVGGDAGEQLVRDPDLSDLVEQTADGRWSFRQALHRDVAYEGLPFRRRRALHLRIGEVLEARETDPTTRAADLSFHFAAGGAREKAWQYSIVAGDSARSDAANAEAVAAYRRALASAPSSITQDDRRSVLEQLADVSMMVSDLAGAENALMRARRYSSDTTDRVRLMRKLGAIREREGRLGAARQWYRRAIELLGSRKLAPDERARLLLAWAGVVHRQGQHAQCLEMARQAEELASEAGDESVVALAHERQQLALTYLGKTDDDAHGRTALGLYAAQGDAAAQARISNNLGIASYYAGAWSDAAKWYGDAVEFCQAAGNVVDSWLGALNKAEILADQGHWSEAVLILDDVVRNWTAAGYQPGVAIALAYRGLALGRDGNFVESRQQLADATGRFEAMGSTELVNECLVRLAEVELIAGDLDAATSVIGELSAGREENAALARRVRLFESLLAARAGDDASAGLRAVLDGNEADYESAVALHALVQLGVDDLAADLARVTERLGIERLPDLL